LTLADKDNVAMKTIGAMPRRPAEAESKGRIPSRGWLTQNRWQGYFPATANPVHTAYRRNCWQYQQQTA
jgi:penicillin amidase